MSTSDPLQALGALSEVVLASGEDLHAVHEEIARTAVAAVGPCEGASLTLYVDGRPAAVASDDWARTLDEMQYDEHEGPCLDCTRIGNVFRVRDLAEETRWPSYAPRAVAAGARSTVSLPLTASGRLIGALNLYARMPNAFAAEDVSVGEIVASHVGLATQVAGAYAQQRQLAEQMRQAMASRAVIEQAKGIIMGQRRCTAEEAFEVLSRASQHANRKLRDIAYEVVQGVSGRH